MNRTNMGPLVLALLAALVVVGDLRPQRGNKGGGGSPPPPAGTVYFTWDDPATPEDYRVYRMDADGSHKTLLPAVPLVSEPSFLLHGGSRWYLTLQANELFVVAEDGSTQIPLTDPWDTIRVVGGTRWDKVADAFVGYQGRDQATTPPSRAIYELAIDWSSGVPLPSGSPVEVLGAADIPLGTDLAPSGWDFSPDGTQLVYEVRDPSAIFAPSLRVMVVNGSSHALVSFGSQAEWSPEGSVIAFAGSEIATVRPDGTGYSAIARGKRGSSVSNPKWAPSGQHLVYLQSRAGSLTGSGDEVIYRVQADGRGATILTGDLQTGYPWPRIYPLAWR